MENLQVFWITGGTVLRKRAIDNILSQIGEHSVYRFEEECSAEFVYTKLNSIDMFSLFEDSKEIYILKHIPAFDGSTKSSNKKFSDMITSLQSNQILIIDGIDPKYNKVPAAAVKKIGKFINLANSLTKKDAIAFLEIEFSKINKEIESTEAKFLVDFVGLGDSQKLASDFLCNIVYKFQHYLGGKKKNITKEDIIMLCGVNRKSVVWDLFTELDKKDFNSALLILENMSKSKRDYRTIVESIVYPMLWKYRLLMYIKEVQKLETDENKVIEKVALLVRNNEENTPMYSDGFVRRVIRGFYNQPPTINLYSRNNLYKIYKALTFHMTNMRFYTESELKLMMTVLFLVICDEVDFQCLRDVNALFMCNKVCSRV